MPKISSPFAIALASFFHSGNFIAAAEHIERSLLDAGVELLDSKLPAPVAEATKPVATALEDAAGELTDDAFRGQPVDASSLESRIAGSVVQALLEAGVIPKPKPAGA